jgi:hypothetical protein
MRAWQSDEMKMNNTSALKIKMIIPSRTVSTYILSTCRVTPPPHSKNNFYSPSNILQDLMCFVICGYITKLRKMNSPCDDVRIVATNEYTKICGKETVNNL